MGFLYAVARKVEWIIVTDEWKQNMDLCLILAPLDRHSILQLMLGVKIETPNRMVHILTVLLVP